jgi:hypothetical protein
MTFQRAFIVGGLCYTAATFGLLLHLKRKNKASSLRETSDIVVARMDKLREVLKANLDDINAAGEAARKEKVS